MFGWAIEALREEFHVEVINIQAQRLAATSGKASAIKLLLLMWFMLRCLRRVLSSRPIDVLYYCPSGPSSIGLVKDMALLSILRLRAGRTVYHFHGTGGIDYLLKLPSPLRWWGKRAMFGPDLAIRCADVTPNDAALCEAERSVVLPNGIPDPGQSQLVPSQDPVHFCFIGTVTEEKGVFDLITAAGILKERIGSFVLDIVGEGTPNEVARLKEQIDQNGLVANIKLHGLLVGDEKFAILRKATLFLFPTYFRAETQPLVAIESLAVGVPIVASDWRGLNSIVDNGGTGLLVSPRNPLEFAEAIITLLRDGRAVAMREACRARYLSHFTKETFQTNVNSMFTELVDHSSINSCR